MNVSKAWLDEYVETNKEAKEIADKLTMTGTKMEIIEKYGVKVSNVVTGKIVEIKDLDDKLKILTIDVGDKKVKAVAKIADVEVGDITAVALDGAKTANKEVKSSEVMGVMSDAMVCHIEELGLSKDEFGKVKESGMLVFREDTKLGQDVSELLKLGDDVIEFELTSNRPDCYCVQGIAKELSASYFLPFNDIHKEDKIRKDEKKEEIDGFKVNVETENCYRYNLKLIKNVKIERSPLWLEQKLIKCGVRPINNIVDITNYVMLTLGEPLHSFDSSKLAGKNITVRMAKEGEKITVLTGEEKELTENDLVIADQNGPVALAGVMGGLESGITENTTEVAFEAATFKRSTVRLAAKRHNLRTDASAQFEKGLPQEATLRALNTACALVEKLGCGEVVDGYIEIYNKPQEENIISSTYKYLNDFIGTKISKEEIDKIFTTLDMEILEADENKFTVKAPWYRQDLVIKEDLTEEVARLHGFEKLEEINFTKEGTVGIKTKNQKLEDKIKDIMVANGYNEIYTYTFLSMKDYDKLELPKNHELRNCIEIMNPLNSDFTHMRTSVVPTLLDAMRKNIMKKNLEVNLFELAKVFIGKDLVLENKLPKEELVLSLGIYDSKVKKNAYGQKFFELKGAVENVLEKLNIFDYDVERYTENPIYHKGQSAKILVNGEIIAVLGKVNPKVSNNYDLPEETYIAEVSFSKLLELYKEKLEYKELPKFQAAERDLAIVVKEDILTGEIEKEVKQVSNKIEEVKLFDVYQGENIEKGFKSMAYSIKLRDTEKTLDTKEIDETMLNIVKVLENKFNAQIRK